ncbi:MAG: hypothetical protein SH819_15130 [Cytophagales bacterium]|nr:hypothetical protein [Cytophagales bacterium]
MTFTAIGTGTFGNSGLDKVEKTAGAENFCSLLNQAKPAQLFSVKVSEIQKVAFPAIYFSAGANITFNNEKYQLSFIQPNNTKMPNLDRDDYEGVFEQSVETIKDIGHSRKVGKKWKSLLTA